MVGMNTASSSEPTISVDPPTSTELPGGTFEVDITVSDVINLYGWEAEISFDGSLLDVVIETVVGKENVTVTGEAVGIGDGSNIVFTLDNKPVVEGSETIYVSGSPLTSGEYYIDYEGGVIFIWTPPPAGAPITADYTGEKEIVEWPGEAPEEGAFLKDFFAPQQTIWLYSIDNEAGTIALGSVVDQPFPETGANATGTEILATIKFYVETEGATLLHFELSKLYTVVADALFEIDHTAVDGFFDNVVTPQKPYAIIEASEYRALEEEPITFDGSASWDPDGFIVSYYWDFDDGTTATGMIVQHAFINDGTYEVTLTVTDIQDLTGNKTTTIQIGTFTEACDLVGKGAWAEHHQHNELVHGRVNTLYAKVMNNATDPYEVKVDFEIWGGREGAPIKTISTDPVEMPGQTTQILNTTDFNTTDTVWEAGWGGPWDTHKNYWPYQYKYMVLARCLYRPIGGSAWEAGEAIEDFSFMVKAAYHDVNVASVTVDPTEVKLGKGKKKPKVDISVTVRNEGDMKEWFDITLKCEPIMTIDVIPVVLDVGEEKTITYQWTVSVPPRAIPYLIKAEVNKLTYETVSAQVNNFATALLTVT